MTHVPNPFSMHDVWSGTITDDERARIIEEPLLTELKKAAAAIIDCLAVYHIATDKHWDRLAEQMWEEYCKSWVRFHEMVRKAPDRARLGVCDIVLTATAAIRRVSPSFIQDVWDHQIRRIYSEIGTYSAINVLWGESKK